MKHILILALLFYTSTLYSQTNWLIGGGSDKLDECFGLTTDSENNVYAAGSYESVGFFGGITLPNADEWPDLFLNKYDANGNILWAKHFENYENDLSFASELFFQNDFLFMTFSFNGTVHIGDEVFSSEGSSDICLAKLDLDGNVIWAKQFASSSVDYCYQIIGDGTYIYLGGRASPGMDFSPLVFTAYHLSAFVLKLDEDGTPVLLINDTDDEGSSSRIWTVDLDSENNIVVGGFYSGRIQFGSTSFENDWGISGFIPFVAKFNPDGECLWLKGVSSNGFFMTTYDIEIDESDNIYFTWLGATYGTDTLIFEGEEFYGENGNSMLGKLDPDGNIIWIEENGAVASSGTWGGALVLDNELEILKYIGQCDNEGYFDEIPFTASAGVDLFIADYDLDGNALAVSQVSGDGGEYTYTGIMDSERNILITGWLNGDSCSYSGMTYENTFSEPEDSNFVYDIFILKIAAEPVTITTLISQSDFTINPNPASIEIIAEFSEAIIGDISLVNSNGQEILSNKLTGESSIKLSIEELPAGIYFIVVRTGVYQYSKKVVIE